MRPLVTLCLAFTACAAQDFTQRGFLENASEIYPQAAPNDAGYLVSGMLLRYEALYKPSPHWHLAAGVDLRTDTHREVDRAFELRWWDRTLRQPAFALRRLSVAYTSGKLSFEIGKQFIRWGKADILNPTDRFAPRDYINVVKPDFLSVTAARLTYGGQSNSIDLVFTPRLTPSRMPLLNQRWVVFPSGVPLHGLGSVFPGGTQYAARWNHIGRIAEYSLSFYDGYHHLPLVDAAALPTEISFRRFYPRIRTYGADVALPLRWLTLKSETAYFSSPDRRADQYALYVLQLERQAGEWFFVGGYAGEVVTNRRALFDFDPERGMSRAFLGRAGYNITASSSLALESVVRQTGRASWTRFEYSRAIRQTLRITGGFNWLRGGGHDFLGQYFLNSHFFVLLRYSF